MTTLSIKNSINRPPWWRAFLFIPLVLVCAAAYGPAPTAYATPHVLPRLPGPVAPGSDAAQTLVSPATTPNWSSNFRFTHDTGLEAQSAVYDQATNTMTVFGGLSINGFADTNAVLLYAPATGDGLWSTLIANGAPGSPVARDSHTAVYDSANNRMIVFGGELFSSGTALNDVWVLSHANGQGGTASWTQLSPSGTPPG